MKRVKTKKKKPPQRKPDDYIRNTTYLHVAIMIRNLMTAFGFSKEQIEEVLEGHVALLDEANNSRNTVAGIIRDAKELSGIDAKKLCDEVLDKRRA